jgi:hypothetical protein
MTEDWGQRSEVGRHLLFQGDSGQQGEGRLIDVVIAFVDLLFRTKPALPRRTAEDGSRRSEACDGPSEFFRDDDKPLTGLHDKSPSRSVR